MNFRKIQHLQVWNAILARYPDNTIVWAHMGLSVELRTLHPQVHSDIMANLFERYPNLHADLSWDILAKLTLMNHNPNDKAINYNHNHEDLDPETAAFMYNQTRVQELRQQLHNETWLGHKDYIWRTGSSGDSSGCQRGICGPTHAMVMYLDVFEKFSDRFLTGTKFVASSGRKTHYPGQKTCPRACPTGCWKTKSNHARQVTDTSSINIFLSDKAFKNIVLGENYFRITGLSATYAPPSVCGPEVNSADWSNIMDQDISIGEYFMEAVDLLNRTQWRYFLPEDSDIDQDGDLSDLEVQHKFNTYMGELFKLIDDDKDNSITEEEFRYLKLDISQLTKAVDIALENFPLRPFFLAADGNGDGVFDENDFIMDKPDYDDRMAGISRGLSSLIDWPRTSRIWEQGGRFLFFADANADGKLTKDEMATKGKELMTKILEVLDENQDGKISLEDLNLNLSIGPIHTLMSELFDDVTAGEGEIDLFNMKIAGQDMDSIWGSELKILDNNRDEKLTAADVFYRLDSRLKTTFLISTLSLKLDKNQDGKIQREELRQFIDEMFSGLDTDKNGALTLEDGYSLLRENGLDCFQVGALRSFIKVFLGVIDTETRKFFGYIFHQFDMDGNGQISKTELEQMHVPCNMSGRSRQRDYDYDNNDDPDHNDTKECDRIIETFFGNVIDLLRYFPDLEMDSGRHGRGGGGYGRYDGGYGRYDGGYGRYDGGYGSRGRDEPHRDTVVDKITNAACQILT